MLNNESNRHTLKRKHITFSNNVIIFRQLKNRDVDNLLKAGYPHQKKRLKQTLVDKGLQWIGLKPLLKGLVAYHNVEKQTIGFLQLNKHSKGIHSIKFAFTNPQFRRLGVASGLFNFAFSLAKADGGRKIFLNVDALDISTIHLYNRLGFRKITNSYEVWAQVRISKSLIQPKNYLKNLDITSTLNRSFLFSVCQQCMKKEWITFFKITSNNLINGFSGDFRHFLFKSAFINGSKNSFILVFRHPFSKTAFAEFFTHMDSEVLPMLDSLIQILHSRGTENISVRLFNINDTSCINMIKEKGFYEYHSHSMGKSL